MGKVETSSRGRPIPVRLNQITVWATSVFLAISCVAAGASSIGVEFEAQITGSNMEGWPVGKRMIGYFIYDASLPQGRQTNSRPMLAFGEPGAMNEFLWYDFTVLNNFMVPDFPFGPYPIDGISLRFPFMCCSSTRSGHLLLTSRNANLFTNDSLPKIIPPLVEFEYGRGIGLLNEETQPYGTVSIQIQRLSMVPGSGLGQPVIYDMKHAQGNVSFRFLTEQLTGYRVEFTDSLANVNWQTLTNMPSSREPIVSIQDAVLQQRFYRARKNPN
jgi:hypothetical protein